MAEKKCFICGEVKDLPLFYKHKGMLDGHLNKCIDCTKKEVRNRIANVYKKDPVWAEAEKKRCLINGRGLKRKYDKETRRKVNVNYKEKYPEKCSARSVSKKIKKINEENQFHHWSYNKEHHKDVIELPVLEHRKLHRYMIYDQERMMYRGLDGVLLDTKEAHIKYYESLKEFL